jgi:hypothetical protein
MKFFLSLIVYSCIYFSTTAQKVRGLYVDGFASILGDSIKEDSLLRFAQNNNFNSLTLYQMHVVHANSSLTSVSSAQIFANFVKKAKTQFAISTIGAAAENANFFKNVIHAYNLQHADTLEQVDVYNLEFEFWINSAVSTGGYYCNTYLLANGYACNTIGAFNFVVDELHIIDSLANSINKQSEVYIGWPDSSKGNALANCGVDRILLHIYIPSASYSSAYQYNYALSRLQDIGSTSTSAKLSLLYSSEPSFMQTWCATNDFFRPYTDFNITLLSETAAFKNNISIDGIQWFAYTDMPKKNMWPSTSISMLQSKLDYRVQIINQELHISDLLNEQNVITIYNMFGQQIFKQYATSSKLNIDLSAVSKGNYLLSIKGKAGIFRQQFLL